MDFYNHKTPHDVVLVVEGQKLYVQIEKLAKWSHVFNEMYKTKLKYDKSNLVNEKNSRIRQNLFSWLTCFKGSLEVADENFAEQKKLEIEMKDVAAIDIRNFLMFIESVSFKVSVYNFRSLTVISLYLKAPLVSNSCREFILGNFPILNKLDLLDIALNFELEATKEECLKNIRCDCTICIRDTVLVAYGMPSQQHPQIVMQRKHRCDEFILKSILNIFKKT